MVTMNTKPKNEFTGSNNIPTPTPTPTPTQASDSPRSKTNSNSDSDETFKKYRCGVCNKGFTRKHNMVSHELIHSTERPHDCPKCDLKFRRIHDLRRHEKLHTGEKPYTCSRCQRSFSRPDALARHQNSPVACNWDAIKSTNSPGTATKSTNENDSINSELHIQSVFPTKMGSCYINLVEKFSPRQSDEYLNDEKEENESEKVEQEKRNRSKISISAITNSDGPNETSAVHNGQQNSQYRGENKKENQPKTREVKGQPDDTYRRARSPQVKHKDRSGDRNFPSINASFNPSFDKAEAQQKLRDESGSVSRSEFQKLQMNTLRLEEYIWGLNQRLEKLEKESDQHNKEARSTLLNYLDQKRGREMREEEAYLDQERGRLDREFNSKKRKRTK